MTGLFLNTKIGADKSSYAYEASKCYVKDKYPEFENFFDKIWEISERELQSKHRFRKEKKKTLDR